MFTLNLPSTYSEHNAGNHIVLPIVGNGGQESERGWCKDKWGLSWQITPMVLTKAIIDLDPAVAKRAFDAMMKMTKIGIDAIEMACRG